MIDKAKTIHTSRGKPIIKVIKIIDSLITTIEEDIKEITKETGEEDVGEDKREEEEEIEVEAEDVLMMAMGASNRIKILIEVLVTGNPAIIEVTVEISRIMTKIEEIIVGKTDRMKIR
jgi:hypothetical protein